MSSISSLSGSSSSSSIYGSRNANIISGLASGLDTESMIENSVQGYKEKINSLIKRQATITWKQEKYRSITDKLVELSKKYTSYSSKTNLASNAFFNNAASTTGTGENGSKIFATGRSSSDITINSVTRLATAARYQFTTGENGSKLKSGNTVGEGVLKGSAIDWKEPTEVSTVQGSLTFAYENTTVSIDFDASEIYKKTGEGESEVSVAQNFVDAINKKLEEQNVTIKGETKKGSDLIKARLDSSGKNIVFENNDEADHHGASLYVKSASGAIVDTLGVEVGKDVKSISAPKEDLFKTVSKVSQISGKSVRVSLDGVTKNIDIGNLTDIEIEVDGAKKKAGDLTEEDLAKTGVSDALNKAMNEAVVKNLQEGMDKAFGKNAITVENEAESDADGAQKFALKFSVNERYKEGATLSVVSSVDEELGLGKDGLYNYVNTGSSIEDLLEAGTLGGDSVKAVKSDDWDPTLNGGAGGWKTPESGEEAFDYSKGFDRAGNRVNENGEIVDEKGNALYALEINGVTIGKYNKEAKLSEIMSDINNNSEAGVKVTYSNMTNKFTFNATNTGSGSAVEMGGGLAEALFGKTKVTTAEEAKNLKGYSAGTDAIFEIEVNGETKRLTRASNEMNIDGITVTLKDTFNEDGKGEVVHLETKADSDTIVNAIKDFAKEINEVLKLAHDEYSTQPLKQSSTQGYDPLTEEEKADLSENELKTYEEKAKTGLLFADSNISGLYNKLRSAISSSGMDVGVLRDIGITTSYDNGVTSLEVNEEKLRNALDTDPDKVRDIFTKTKENGAKSDGFMANISKVLTAYASTSITSPGILVKQAGTNKSSISLLNNAYQKQQNRLDEEIERWQTKMSSKIDYYTRQYTALEQLMNQMNSQSSALSGLMGG